jgi:hypothetical protein
MMNPAPAYNWPPRADCTQTRLRVGRREVRVQRVATISSGTPVPAFVSDSGLLDLGTMGVLPTSDLRALVRTAHEHVRGMAFLPIDPELDELVDITVEAELSARRKRPLARKA